MCLLGHHPHVRFIRKNTYNWSFLCQRSTHGIARFVRKTRINVPPGPLLLRPFWLNSLVKHVRIASCRKSIAFYVGFSAWRELHVFYEEKCLKWGNSQRAMRHNSTHFTWKTTNSACAAKARKCELYVFLRVERARKSEGPSRKGCFWRQVRGKVTKSYESCEYEGG